MTLAAEGGGEETKETPMMAPPKGEEDTPASATEEVPKGNHDDEETPASVTKDPLKVVTPGLLEDGEPVGLTSDEAAQALATHGYNEVVIKEQPIILQILSRYLGIVPLFMTTTAVLSAAIFSDCSDDPKYVRNAMQCNAMQCNGMK
jgi:hypothetical protein